MAGQTAPLPATAALLRLAALAPLDGEARTALEREARLSRHYRARRDLVTEGQEITQTQIVLTGWAARVRTLQDGRRQIIGFLLPGDLIDSFGYDRGLALSTVTAITDTDIGTAPQADLSPTLARAYAVSRVLDEKHLMAQVVRLGRYDALERIADFLLETLERLQMAGLAAGGRCTLPVTQEVLADTLGLTSVHLNRVIQVLRREGAVVWKGRDLFVPDPVALAQRIGRADLGVVAV